MLANQEVWKLKFSLVLLCPCNHGMVRYDWIIFYLQKLLFMAPNNCPGACETVLVNYSKLQWPNISADLVTESKFKQNHTSQSPGLT